MEIIIFPIYFVYINEPKGDYLVEIVLVSAICSTSYLHSASNILPKAQKVMSFYSLAPSRSSSKYNCAFPLGSMAEMGTGWVFDKRTYKDKNFFPAVNPLHLLNIL